MNRKFWRWVEKLASDKLAKDETHRNWPGIKNEFEKTRNEVHEAWKFNGDLLVQRVVGQVSSRLSDQSVVVRDIINDTTTKVIDERSVGIKSFVERGNSLMMSSIGRIFVNVHGLETKIGDWVNQIIRGQEEITRQDSIHDQSNSDRYLSLVQQIQHLNSRMDQDRNEMLRIQALQYDAFTLQVENIRKALPKQDNERYDSAPTLEWIIDQMDELIELGKVMEAIRDNQAPRENTIYKAVKCIRSLDIQYGATDVRDEVQSLIHKWDGAPELRLVS